jgi:hypothetical protein
VLESNGYTGGEYRLWCERVEVMLLYIFGGYRCAKGCGVEGSWGRPLKSCGGRATDLNLATYTESAVEQECDNNAITV